jgi:uncharacterized protein
MPRPITAARDWILTSPPIFAALPGLALMPPAARMRIADTFGVNTGVPGDELESHPPSRRSHSIGHRAEHLLADALCRCPGITLIANRLPVLDGNRTMGELDLLYDDEWRACRVHCELSVRLLLQYEPSGAATAWCSTDPSQRWSDKLDRLRQHQLPLGQHPSVPRHPTWPTVDEALILGWLLQPMGERWPEAGGAAPDHLRGWWLRHGISEPLRSSRAARFFILPHHDWLGAVHIPSSTQVLAPGELSQALDRHFARHDHALIVAEVVRDDTGGWHEIGRGAVVHRRWPGKPDRWR